MRGTPHLQRIVKRIDDCDDCLYAGSPTHPNIDWMRNDRSRRVRFIGDFIGARHISSPSGVRQRLAARQLTGRLSKARNVSLGRWMMEVDQFTRVIDRMARRQRRAARQSKMGNVRHWLLQCRRQTWTSWRFDISPKALGPACGLSAVLGRNALHGPGDCDQARRVICRANWDESQEPCPARKRRNVGLRPKPTFARFAKTSGRCNRDFTPPSSPGPPSTGRVRRARSCARDG